MLTGKKIVLGVTGSIAAYKSAYLVRLLVQSGAEVRVVMSPGSLEFVTPLTFSTLSKHRIYSDFTENKLDGKWNHHVELANWADLMVIAPLTANTLAKMAGGQSDNFLLATYMSVQCKVMIAPAMDREMYHHPGTTENLDKLRSFGHLIIEPSSGELASGLSGKGRMEEPDQILEAIVSFFHPELPLAGKKFLVTAGPTYEKIDPVRFIGNYSSGKMGLELAKSLSSMGAQVYLVCGPMINDYSNPSILRKDVESAKEMYEAVKEIWQSMDGGILAAAVADFRPRQRESSKIKKNQGLRSIELEETEDIAAFLGQNKSKAQILVGFALETDNEEENARGKMERKNMDMIVLNSLRDLGAGFSSETNKITLIWPGNKKRSFGLKNKSAVAEDIVAEVIKLVSA
jgi:phosphopantothenoylcysteine decarboxylase/phosphopantothenate--cysteine ligase